MWMGELCDSETLVSTFHIENNALRAIADLSSLIDTYENPPD